jgi:hypothetical protein
MPSSGMLHHVAVVGTDVSEERIAFIIIFLQSVFRLLVTADLSSSQILVTLRMEAIRSSEMSVLTRATRPNIPEDDFFHYWNSFTRRLK